MDDNLARRYSHAPDYSRFAKESIAQMVEQVGKPVFAEDGRMKKGVIIRHLMLPGQLADTKKIIRWIYETLGNRVYLSLMNQVFSDGAGKGTAGAYEKIDPERI